MVRYTACHTDQLMVSGCKYIQFRCDKHNTTFQYHENCVSGSTRQSLDPKNYKINCRGQENFTGYPK